MANLRHYLTNAIMIIGAIAAAVLAYGQISYGWFSQNKEVEAGGISVKLDAGSDETAVINYMWGSGESETGKDPVLMPGGYLIYVADSINAESGLSILSVRTTANAIDYPEETYTDSEGSTVNRVEPENYFYRTADGEKYVPEAGTAREFFENNFRFPAAYALKFRAFVIGKDTTLEELIVLADAIEWTEGDSLAALPEPQNASPLAAGVQAWLNVSKNLTDGLTFDGSTARVAVVMYFDPATEISTEIDGTVYTMTGSNPFMSQSITIGVSGGGE